MAADSESDIGFTLVEVLVALMILTIVLTALAPVFYGAMKATELTNQRSVANGLAVSANEQLRSVPYYDVGYQTNAPSLCQGQNPVILGTGVTTPIPGSTTQTVGPVTYTLMRCLYWVNSSIGNPDPQAYKQSVVTVSWTVGTGSYHVSQTSAIYPGGEGPYSGTQNDYLPGATTTTIAAAPPSTPTAVVAVDDSTNPTNTIDVSWTASSPMPASYYIVEYSSTYGGSGALGAPFTSSPPVYQTTWAATVAPGATYYVQVVAVAGDGVTTSPPSSPVAHAASTTTATTTTTTTTTTVPGSTTTVPATTTTVPATTTTTVATCHLTNLVATPTSGVVDKNGFLVGVTNSSIQLSVNASGPCVNVTVGYSPTGATTTYAAMSGAIPGTLTGSAGTSVTTWNPGNQPFTAYVNGTQYAPLIQVQVDLCQENGKSGKC